MQVRPYKAILFTRPSQRRGQLPASRAAASPTAKALRLDSRNLGLVRVRSTCNTSAAETGEEARGRQGTQQHHVHRQGAAGFPGAGPGVEGQAARPRAPP